MFTIPEAIRDLKLLADRDRLVASALRRGITIYPKGGPEHYEKQAELLEFAAQQIENGGQ